MSNFDIPEWAEGLTLKQRKFVDAYWGEAKGNATKSAKMAGYKGNDVTLASVGKENLRKPRIRKAIEAARDKRWDPATAEEVIQFFTDGMRDNSKSDRHQRRCSENMARILAMFIERRRHEGQVSVTDTRLELHQLLQSAHLVDELQKLEQSLT
jgi:hypothetical protein